MFHLTTKGVVLPSDNLEGIGYVDRITLHLSVTSSVLGLFLYIFHWFVSMSCLSARVFALLFFVGNSDFSLAESRGREVQKSHALTFAECSHFLREHDDLIFAQTS